MTMSDAVTTPKRKVRDLSKAVTLRARDIFDLYGIPSSTLCELANHPDPKKRIPSRLIPGRKGRQGIRLYDRAEFEAYLARWNHKGEAA